MQNPFLQDKMNYLKMFLHVIYSEKCFTAFLSYFHTIHLIHLNQICYRVHNTFHAVNLKEIYIIFNKDGLQHFLHKSLSRHQTVRLLLAHVKIFHLIFQENYLSINSEFNLSHVLQNINIFL